MERDGIKWEQNGDVRIITLGGMDARDEKKLAALADALRCANADKTVKTVILRQAGDDVPLRGVAEEDLLKAAKAFLARKILPTQTPAPPKPRRKFPLPPRRL